MKIPIKEKSSQASLSPFLLYELLLAQRGCHITRGCASNSLEVFLIQLHELERSHSIWHVTRKTGHIWSRLGIYIELS